LVFSVESDQYFPSVRKSEKRIVFTILTTLVLS
jgi:hypothetical protein